MTDEYGRIHTDGSRSGGQPVVVTEKAHTMILEVLAEWGLEPDTTTPQQLTVATTEALCRAIDQSEDLRKPKTVTVTVVSAYDRKAMNTFKINPAEKTYVRPDHSMFGYVFEPEDDANDPAPIPVR